jgi:uncharacterized protein (DUF1499 family)
MLFHVTSLFSALAVVSASWTGRPDPAGVERAGLPPCPGTPNCVSSQSPSPKHHVEPLRYTDTLDEARTRVLRIVSALPRTRWVAQEDGYLHAEVRSRLFRFVDDLEFLFPNDEKVVHVRSAARSGSHDLGVNRRRVEWIRARFERSTK